MLTSACQVGLHLDDVTALVVTLAARHRLLQVLGGH